MNEEMSEELKPCPHDGFPADLHPAYPLSIVRCRVCGARTMGTTEAEAVEKWNLRTDDAAKPERVRELRDELRSYPLNLKQLEELERLAKTQLQLYSRDFPNVKHNPMVCFQMPPLEALSLTRMIREWLKQQWVELDERLPDPHKMVALINIEGKRITYSPFDANPCECGYMFDRNGAQHWIVSGNKQKDINAYTHWARLPELPMARWPDLTI